MVVASCNKVEAMIIVMAMMVTIVTIVMMVMTMMLMVSKKELLPATK